MDVLVQSEIKRKQLNHKNGMYFPVSRENLGISVPQNHQSNHQIQYSVDTQGVAIKKQS